MTIKIFKFYPGDSDTLSIWKFTEDDYNGGVGTSVADAVSGVNLTIDLSEDILVPWKEGYFNYAARAWYCLLSTEYNGLTNYTIDILLETGKNILPDKQIFVGTNDTLVYPIFAWSSDTHDELTIQYTISTGVKVEGFFIDAFSKIYYGSGITKQATSVGYYFEFDVYEELGSLLGENFLQYVSLTVDTVDSTINYYLNGTLVSSTVVDNIGYVSSDDDARKKIAGYGFGIHKKGATYPAPIGLYLWEPFSNEEACYLYYNSMKLMRSCRDANSVREQYLSLFGTDFEFDED